MIRFSIHPCPAAARHGRPPFARRGWTAAVAALGLLALALAGAPPAAAQGGYTFQLAPTSFTAISNTLGLNNYNLDLGTFAQYAVLYARNGATTAVRFPGAFDTVAMDLTNSGAVVGWFDDPTFTTFGGFVRAPDGTFETYFYPGAAATFFQAGSDSGRILGQQFDADFNVHYFLVGGGRPLQDLTFPGYDDAGWVDLNNQEVLLGARYDFTIGSEQTLLSSGGSVEPVVIPGSSDVFPGRINNAGTICGTYDIHSPDYFHFEQHGFVRTADGRITQVDFDYPWPATEPFMGGTLNLVGTGGTSLTAINDRGQVTGLAFATYAGKIGNVVTVLIDARTFIATPQ
jgi:hypothetical protein